MSVKHSVKHSRRSVKQPVKRVALAYVKDTTRSWLRGWKRFLSIAVISLLGVSVLTGIYAGCRDMFLAADRFYDGQGLHDIQILSTYGLTDDDIVALRRIDGVDTIQPERTQSATTDVAGTDKSVTMTEIGVEGLDLPYLQEGRMPTKAGEVAVTEKYLIDSGHSIGDTITITPPTPRPRSESICPIRGIWTEMPLKPGLKRTNRGIRTNGRRRLQPTRTNRGIRTRTGSPWMTKPRRNSPPS